MSRSIVLVVSALVLAGAVSSADARSLVHKVQLTTVNDACRSDAERLCPDVRLGRGRMAACLVDQLEALSQPCYDALTVTAALRSCEADRRRYCPGVKPGRGRVLDCLADHTNELSPPCVAAIEANLPGFPGE